MITNLLRKNFRKFIVELGNSYIKEENSEFLKREEKITKLNINTDEEVLMFREVFDKVSAYSLNCGTISIPNAIKNMDLVLLYDYIYNSYRENKVYSHKIFKMFDIVCDNVHNDIDLKYISNSVIYVSNVHKKINIYDCNNCLIVVNSVHGDVNIDNCTGSTFINNISFHRSPKYSNVRDCKILSLKEHGKKYDTSYIGELYLPKYMNKRH